MTIVRIQIDESRDRIGFSINRLRSTTEKEMTMAASVAQIAQAAVGEAMKLAAKKKEGTNESK